jgi:hypothetical protein
MRYFVFALLVLTCNAYAEEGWFPYWFPADPSKAPDYMGIPAYAFNAGKDVLEPPAGKHGFVKVKDGHFYFEDGTRARFWGTNLCFGACFPEHKDAEIMANRIAYFGFNAVRLHHMDMLLEPDGIFESRGKLSPRQLDRLDYLVFQLKQHGIYVDINTLVSRFFKESEGVIDADKLGMAAKPVSLFDAKLIELQKQYDKDLLTHLNPYTKLRYCDDPAVCLVEITNENTLAELNPSFLPQYYQDEMNNLFNKWLTDKYGSLERAQNLWKPKGNLTPDFYNWLVEEHNGAALDIKKTNDGMAIITTEKITGTSWHLQYRYDGIKLKKDKGYVLKFAAKGTIPIELTCQQNYSPWEWLGLSDRIKLTREFKTHESPFTATANCNNAKVAFIIGSKLGVITIKDIVLAESDKSVDMRDFLSGLEAKYLKGMKDYLHNEIGVKCPVGIGGHWNPAQLKLQKECLDYVDKHGYWDHPQFPRKQWDANDFRMHNKPMPADTNHGMIGEFKESSPKNAPYVISEWNHCYPNPYAYETPVLLASTARQENWDALFQFAFTHGWQSNSNFDNINSYFDINSNAQQLILCSYGSRIFIKGEHIDIPKVGQIKNVDSGWNKSGRFDWGSGPTLLKQP